MVGLKKDVELFKVASSE